MLMSDSLFKPGHSMTVHDSAAQGAFSLREKKSPSPLATNGNIAFVRFR